MQLIALSQWFILAALSSDSDLELDLNCPQLQPQQLAAFEARARTDLAVRRVQGVLRLRCDDQVSLSFRALGGPEVSSEQIFQHADVDSLLAALERLTATQPDTPARSRAESPNTINSAPPSQLETSRAPFAIAGNLALRSTLWDGTLTGGAQGQAVWGSSTTQLTLGGQLSTTLAHLQGFHALDAAVLLGVQQRVVGPWRLAAALGAGHLTVVAPTTESRHEWYPLAQIGALAQLDTQPQLLLGIQLTIISKRIRVLANEEAVFQVWSFAPGLIAGLAFGQP